MRSSLVARIAKKLLVIFAVTLLLLSLYLVRAYRRYESQRKANARITAGLEAGFQSQLAHFQRDLPLGTPRVEVEKYLTSQEILHGRDRTIIVKLGDEPGDGLTCDRWSVYAYFEFGPAQAEAEPSPNDDLKIISLQRIGHCL
jgi:hypothetical protein